MDRVTRKNLDLSFETLVRVAQGAGIDTEGWSFGRHYGLNYQILDETRASGQAVSRTWVGMRAAYDGLQDMIQALVHVKA